MPRALIVLDWDRLKGPVVKAKYPDIEFDQDLPMKIFMAHTAQEPVEIQLALQFGSANVASRITQFTEKGVLRRILLILLLNTEENPRNFFDMLVEFEKTLKKETDASYFPELVKNTYIDKTATQISAIFNADELYDKIIKRSKQLLEAGEIQKAQSLISKAKSIPPRIAQTLQLAENALNEKDFNTAATHYETVSNLLFQVDETALKQQYHEKAEKVKKIPILQKERKEYVENAQKALKKVDFSTAIEWFQAAAKHSEELNDEVKANEYSKKGKALENYLEAEREAKLKESEKSEEPK